MCGAILRRATVAFIHTNGEQTRAKYFTGETDLLVCLLSQNIGREGYPTERQIFQQNT